MNLAPNQGIKTLWNGDSHNGGSHAWSLPTQGPDGAWVPGDWTVPVKPVWCRKGYHLTREPARWWRSDKGMVAYLAEYDGATAGPVAEDTNDPTKFAVERCRLLRPLSVAELASLSIFAEGKHEVRVGACRAYGSAQVWAYGSAQVWAYGSAQVRAYGSAQVRASDAAQVTASDGAQVTASDSAQVRAYGSAQVTASDGAQVTAYGSAQVWAYGSAQVRAYGSAQVTAYGSAQVRAYGSAQVRAYGSAQVHAGDGATADVFSLAAIATRADRGVIVDRRSGSPKVYAKRLGLDGWRYRDGKFVQVRVRAKGGAR